VSFGCHWLQRTRLGTEPLAREFVGYDMVRTKCLTVEYGVRMITFSFRKYGCGPGTLK